jgi:glyoxylase-like metal-dependent hydrolase (beta-lactamase superfamily II)
MRLAFLKLLLVTICIATPGFAAENERSVTKIADGVYVIRHRDTPFEGGNTTVVIGERGLFVVDSTQLPEVGRYDISEIKKLTDKPVRYLLNTHWHNDHNSGNAEYMKAYPGLAIIAQRETKVDMELYVAHAKERWIAEVAKQKQRIATGKDESGKALTPEQLGAAKTRLGIFERLVNDFAGWTYQGPTLVFDEDVDVDLGGRQVQVKFLGRGNTAGDAIAWLPQERILASGDLLVSPIPYTYDGYPTEWVEVLNKIEAMQPAVIVPGHGQVMRDFKYLSLFREFLQSALGQLNARLKIIGPAEFREFDDVKDAIDLSSFKARFSNGDKELEGDFDEIQGRLKHLVFIEAQMR